MAMDFIHVGMSISLIGNIASGFSMPDEAQGHVVVHYKRFRYTNTFPS